jgi:hypothetical protein
MLIYTFPTESYNPEDLPAADLDDIEILGPPANLQKSTTQQTSASFKVAVKSPQLTNLSARITLTRKQDITGGLPSANPWSLTTIPTASPKVEAHWSCTNAYTVTSANAPTFSAPFMPNEPGNFRFTFAVDADELAETVETYLDVTVNA